MKTEHERALTREQAAWSFDWGELQRTALQFARLWARRSDEAQEVAQDAIVALFACAGEVRNPIPWLFVVTRRLLHRTERRERRRIEGEQIWAHDTRQCGLRRSTDTVLRSLVSCRNISVKQRRLLLYRGIGYTDAEIAWLLSCPRSSVGPMMARAVRRVMSAHDADDRHEQVDQGCDRDPT
jgi:DNA-directed RNA polymerase specialized sigma24 family protein